MRHRRWVTVLSETPTSTPPPGAAPLWGSPAPAGGGQSARPRPPVALASVGGEPLEPLSRRLLRVAGLLSLLLILVVANSFISNDENPFNPVAKAAERAERYPGFRFNAYIVFSSPALAQPIAASGNGAYNAGTKRTRMELSVNSSLTGPGHFFVISDDRYTYESGSSVEDELPPGKSWVRTEKSVKDREDFSVDFDESMRMLSDSGGVHVVGHQSINGRMTRRYRAEIPLDKLVELLRERDQDEVAEAYEGLEGVAPTGISAEVWIDHKNVLRRMRMVMPMPGKEGQPPLTMDIRMDLFAFGAHPDIRLPDSDSVVEGPLGSSSAPTSAQVS
jgi:hypothetical protein